ncbi:hypothetical protein HU200_005792 [Digitaria exilis]|uniref:F-box domain-containing protein n=1 Tax=Digitaria exilis TaxID=1010633 RepID=A0A835FS66_9POAL|nr:hypothetical protein HU200_005792 [Digitaria exilis]
MAESRRSKRVAGDRLSALPEELLHSIMSFLMARQTVQTSVLARRWKDLWRSTPCLNIDHREFAGGGGGAALSGCSAGQSAWSKLHGFTSSLLKSHHAPVLEKFQLHVGAYHSAPAVDGWIRRGARCRPAALEIAAANQCGWLTPCLAPAAPCRLTRMSLCRVRLDGGFAEHLRSGCPVLEDLVLTGCHCAFYEIVSNTLRSLTIDCCQCASPSKVSRTVTAPALASFRLIVPIHASHDAFLVNGGCSSGPELQATITVTREDPYGASKSMSTFRLLGSLCNVTTLELWGLRYSMDVRCLSVRIHSSNNCSFGPRYDLARDQAICYDYKLFVVLF